MENQQQQQQQQEENTNQEGTISINQFKDVNNSTETLPLIGDKLNFFKEKPNSTLEKEDENFHLFVKSVCCPAFSFQGVTFILSVIQLITYITCLIYGGIQKDPLQLFAPNILTLETFGWLIPWKLHQGQIWRIISSFFLHSNFVHLVFNIITQNILGSYIEAMVGQFKTGILYWLTIIGSGFFSCCISKSSGTLSSLAIFSILGEYSAYTIVNYNSLDSQMGKANKFFNIIFIFFMVCINMTYSYEHALIISYSNISGVLFSFLFGLIATKPFDKNDGLFLSTRVWYWIGLISVCIAIPLEITLFYTVVKF